LLLLCSAVASSNCYGGSAWGQPTLLTLPLRHAHALQSMYIRVKRKKTTIFLVVEPTDTVLEVKQRLQALIDKVSQQAQLSSNQFSFAWGAAWNSPHAGGVQAWSRVLCWLLKYMVAHKGQCLGSPGTSLAQFVWPNPCARQ
jgi:hypothetical protein